jgi:nitronate monooxygenase
MIETRLTRRFAITHPILCAPMALTTGGRLAGAVSAAGGLGILGGGYAGLIGNEPDLDEQYRAAGNAPIGIGLITWAALENPQVVEWAIARRPVCLFLSFGDPAPFARAAADAGIPVICQAQTMRHVEEALDAGAMAVVAQGTEAGGHGGRRFRRRAGDRRRSRRPHRRAAARRDNRRRHDGGSRTRAAKRRRAATLTRLQLAVRALFDHIREIR